MSIYTPGYEPEVLGAGSLRFSGKEGAWGQQAREVVGLENGFLSRTQQTGIVGTMSVSALDDTGRRGEVRAGTVVEII